MIILPKRKYRVGTHRKHIRGKPSVLPRPKFFWDYPETPWT